MTRKFLSIILIAVLSALMLAACSPNPQTAIIGGWECRDNSQPHDYICELVFTNNGRFTDRDGDAGDWRIFDNMLTLDFDDYAPHTYSISFSGNNRFTLRGDDIRVTLDRNSR